MTFEEKKIIKERCNQYKRIYYNLKKELKNCENPEERYEILCELSALGIEIGKMRKVLIDEQFRKYHFDDLLSQIILAEDRGVGRR